MADAALALGVLAGGFAVALLSRIGRIALVVLAMLRTPFGEKSIGQREVTAGFPKSDRQR